MPPAHPHDVVDLDALLACEEPPARAFFALEELDSAIGPVRPGDLVVFGGHAGAPANALALRVALTAARRGAPTLLVTSGLSSVVAARWLLSTTGAPLSSLWGQPGVPDWLASVVREELGGLPLAQVDGLGRGLDGMAHAIDREHARTGRRFEQVVILGTRWLDPRRSIGLVLFELKQLAMTRDLVVVATLDTRLPGPREVERMPRPDTFDETSVLGLADLTVLLSLPSLYKHTPEDDEFRVYVVGSALNRGTICRLRNPRWTMQVLPQWPSLDDAERPAPEVLYPE